jgi:sterol desaturase/sphingolipid hydroxylase (fatty acid hydroxylase superfamily)
MPGVRFMEHFILAHEQTLRLAAFAGTLCAMGLWELAAPRRQPVLSKIRRWITNLGLSVLNSLILRFLLRILPVGVATWAQAQGFGLFNLMALPTALEWLLAILILDLMIYGQHVVFHHVPLFWRLHKVHHADPEIDSSTGIRFHPIEIILSMGIKLAAVSMLGVAPVAIILFEILLNATSLFNHGNVRLPLSLDRILRRFIVTPDMHRVHHSTVMTETNSNFGFNLSIWDRLFGTYQAQPQLGHLDMKIGLSEYRDGSPAKLIWSLGLPFRSLRGKERA